MVPSPKDGTSPLRMAPPQGWHPLMMAPPPKDGTPHKDSTSLRTAPPKDYTPPKDSTPRMAFYWNAFSLSMSMLLYRPSNRDPTEQGYFFTVKRIQNMKQLVNGLFNRVTQGNIACKSSKHIFNCNFQILHQKCITRVLLNSCDTQELKTF